MNRDNRIKCNECHDYLENGEMVHSIDYGFWQSEENKFENDGQEEYYCRTCWNKRSPLQEGIKMEIDTPKELVGILESSNGKLVADFNSQIIGTRVFMRVIDGRSEYAYVRMRRVGDNTINFKPEYEQKTKQDALELTEDVLTSGSLPPLIILINVDKTPFEDYPDLSDKQSNIEEF